MEEKKRGKVLMTAAIVIVVVLALAAGLLWFYSTRIQTVGSIRKFSDYGDYDIYHIDVHYDYDLDKIAASGYTDTASFTQAVLKEALPLLPVKIEAPNFGCSAFSMHCADGGILMGRNYDFKIDTSMMLVYTTPKDGYRSIGSAALSNLKDNQPLKDLKSKLTALAAPFVCLDGINEKGVSIAVLTLDSEPLRQQTGKPSLATTMLIRLVLDRAASTEEAIDLIAQYDNIATGGRDYHFYISDASGDGRVVEWDPESETRNMTVTVIPAITNFYGMYIEKVLPNQKNGIYGHGKERYDKIMAVMEEQSGALNRDAAWEALKASSQLPKEGDVTSNTQWSIVYDNKNLTAEIVLRRNWEDKYLADISEKDSTIRIVTPEL